MGLELVPEEREIADLGRNNPDTCGIALSPTQRSIGRS
jgi:hypothetical protein